MMMWQRVIVTAGHLWMTDRCQLPPEPPQCFPPAVYPNLQSPPFPGGKCMHLLPGSGFNGVKNMGREKELIAQVHAYSPFSLFVKWLLISPNTGMFVCLFICFQTPSFPLGLGSTGSKTDTVSQLTQQTRYFYPRSLRGILSPSPAHTHACVHKWRPKIHASVTFCLPTPLFLRQIFLLKLKFSGSAGLGSQEGPGIHRSSLSPVLENPNATCVAFTWELEIQTQDLELA